MIGRLIVGIAALALIAGLATGGVGLYDRQHRPHYMFWNAEGAQVDTASNSDSVRVIAYSSRYTGADTAGHANALTYAKADSGGGEWYSTNPKWDICLVVRDSFGTIDTLAQDFLIMGRVLGDSVITDTLVFKADVVPGLAIVSMSGTKLDSGSVSQLKIAAGAIDSTRLASGSVHLAHVNSGILTLGTGVPKINPARIKTGSINPFAVTQDSIYDATADSGAVVIHWWKAAAPYFLDAAVRHTYDLSIRCPVDDTLYVTWGANTAMAAGCDSNFYYVILANPDD